MLLFMTCNKVIVILFLLLILIDTLIAYVIASTFITIDDIENTCGNKCENVTQAICHNRNRHCEYKSSDKSCNSNEFICSSDLKYTLKFSVSIILPVVISSWLASMIMIITNVSPWCLNNIRKISLISEYMRVALLISLLVLVICSKVYISEDTSELYFILSMISIIMCFMSYFIVCKISSYQQEVISEETISLIV